MDPAPHHDPAWLAAVAAAQVHDGQVTVTVSGKERAFRLFFITGFPCSGLDWVGRLLSLHPAVIAADGPHRLGPLGGTRKPSKAEMQHATDEAMRASLVAAWKKPGATHLGVMVLPGDARGGDPEITVLRDGRDVVVAWTLRQLRENGEALQRFVVKDDAGNRMPEIHRRFEADPIDILERNSGLLLSDYDWVRYASHLWDDEVTGHFSAMSAIYDGKLSGPEAQELYFEAARSSPLTALTLACRFLGLAPPAADLVPDGGDPVSASEPDQELVAEWEVGRWKRYFTPTASNLFKMEAEAGLQCVTRNYGDDEWAGECGPATT